ncbi:MAG: F0F1-type ATP synthase assembly protein I [Bradymonadia bacterium]
MSELSDKTRVVWKGARTASVGLEMGVAVAIGAGIGYWLDSKYGWSPKGVLIGTLFGVGAATKAVWTAVKTVQNQAARDDAAEAAQSERDG